MSEHPARVAAQRSMAAVSAKDRQGWLDLFADDGCVEDPVGRSPLDEEGEGHRGKAAIGAFWDKTIALMEGIEFDLIASYAAGDEVANVATITTHMPGDMVGRTDGVFVYRVDDEGRLTNLRAFWEFDAMIATIRKRS
jgi:ketosteroid isomerase-like protein